MLKKPPEPPSQISTVILSIHVFTNVKHQLIRKIQKLSIPLVLSTQEYQSVYV